MLHKLKINEYNTIKDAILKNIVISIRYETNFTFFTKLTNDLPIFCVKLFFLSHITPEISGGGGLTEDFN